MKSWCALAASLWIAVLASAAGAERPVRIAVLPMVVHSVESPGYLRDGLADMLSARLGLEPGVTVVRIEDPALATTNADQARQAAQGAGADYVLFGSFTRFGEGASLDVHCVSVSGSDPRDSRSIFIQSGSLGEIIPRIDGLAERVVRHVTDKSAPAGSGVASSPGPNLGGPEVELRNALSELDSLRGRLERLEEKVYGDGDGEQGVSAVAPEAGGQSVSSNGQPLP